VLTVGLVLISLEIIKIPGSVPLLLMSFDNAQLARAAYHSMVPVIRFGFETEIKKK